MVTTNRTRKILLLASFAILCLCNKVDAVRSPSSYAAASNSIAGNPRSSNGERIVEDAEVSSSSAVALTSTDGMIDTDIDIDIEIDDGDANTNDASLRGGAMAKSMKANKTKTPLPSMYWAVLHNWLYFLSLGFNLLNIPYMVREIVDGKGAKTPSPQSIALSGNVEAVDKILTFCGVAFLSKLSDRHGRKPLLAWAAFGFALTNLLQVVAGSLPNNAKFVLYLADAVDGISSCMNPVCQAYVADVSSGGLAANLGILQGISIGGAFVIAFPVGGMLGAKFGPKLPILLAAGFQILNGLLATFVTPESNQAVLLSRTAKSSTKTNKKRALPASGIDWAEVNPLIGLKKLFGIGAAARGGAFGSTSVGLLRTASMTYFFLSLARGSLDAQFVNYSNLRFGWTQAQSGPVLVMVGLMLALVPRVLVPLLGLPKSIVYGLVVYAAGLAGAGLVGTAPGFVGAIAVVSLGCVCVPALQALLANLAGPGQSGALLGAVGSMGELTGAISSTLYAGILATFATSAPISSRAVASLKQALPDLPGMHFLVGGTLALTAWGIATQGLKHHKGHPALAMGVGDKSALLVD